MRDDIRTVLLACVELDPDLSLDLLIDALVDLSQTFQGEISCKVYNRLLPRSLFIWNIMFSAGSR